MRYRIKVVRTEVAERVVRAADEDTALAKVREELDRPYGFLGRWQTERVEVAEVEVLPDDRFGSPGNLSAGGPMLMSIKKRLPISE